jgi:NAD(P)-dependent dehydrogenase (short-subunit alcohol dehydrogenase family)
MLAGRIALVTGANKGIGKAIAAGLARSGLTVLLGSRDLARGEAAARDLAGEGAVKALQLDVTDAGSIQAAVARVEAEHGRLDVLVNNAGVNAGRQVPSATSIEDMRYVYETNVFAVVAVTNAFLPLLRASPDGRIVNVTSLRGSVGDEGAWVGQPSMAYSSSKTALNALTAHYARELAATSVKVFGAAPGHVATDFNQFRGARTPDQGAAIAVRLATGGQAWISGRSYDDDRALPW